MNDISQIIAHKEARLQELEAERQSLITEIEQLKYQAMQNQVNKLSEISSLQQQFTSAEKIQIYMGLFRGRMDVFAKRWENLNTGKSGYSPACANEWIRGVCQKPKIKCSDCTKKAFIPLNKDIVLKHFTGDMHNGMKRDFTIGVYPMLKDDTCWFLVVDFDKENWQSDVAAFIKTCKSREAPVSLEISRSGKGAHVWVFFEQPISAMLARKMGTVLLTETMQNYPEIGFESYDRFFPNQDTLPAGGFGNLIALPLQHFPRTTGNSVFVDENFTPFQDQWAYLASVIKMTSADVNKIIESSILKYNVLGLDYPDVDDRPWELSPSRSEPEVNIPQELLPKSITITLANLIFIPKKDLPPILLNKIIRLAAFNNPEFYKAQAMRLPVYDKPRVIDCAESFTNYIGLPRGCMDTCLDLFKSFNIQVIVEDSRYLGTKIKAKFIGELTPEQKKAAKELFLHDTGILAATTAFGKTVVGAYMIAKRKVNTLIIVHRVQLMQQWVERLKMFVDLAPKQIGIIGGGKHKTGTVVDVAVMQSLIKKNTVDDIVAKYGQIIVDECHHLSAVSFEAVLRACKAKYVLGLTATIARKDGHHPIIFMQCGAVRYTVDAKQQAQLRPFGHKVIVRNTTFNYIQIPEQKPQISNIYAEIVSSEDRNQLIIKDVLSALQSGRSPLLLTERKEHVMYFAEHFSKLCKNVVVMVGGRGAKQSRAVAEQLASVADNEERLLIATGKYIGEGFDDSRLDTLFLAMPISWHGTLAQYAGRLHRTHQNKQEVIIYDYADTNVAMLARMAEKRRKGYVNLGYNVT